MTSNLTEAASFRERFGGQAVSQMEEAAEDLHEQTEEKQACPETDHGGTRKQRRKTHGGERPHRCRECEFSTSKMSALKRHVRTSHAAGKGEQTKEDHGGERPFQCAVCDYSAARKLIVNNEGEGDQDANRSVEGREISLQKLFLGCGLTCTDREVVRRGVCLGIVDMYPSRTGYLDMTSPSWVRLKTTEFDKNYRVRPEFLAGMTSINGFDQLYIESIPIEAAETRRRRTEKEGQYPGILTRLLVS
ncbi:CTCF [Branchiostoma lanceolatum]|uniref:CTCF protein n=1 Tax=Branchiostoma lanceolatum TaxID=7740 RepID=A0A8J9VGM9_BRALA|nr:CTCF [Branchiostoma lanceolatum]